MTKLKFIDLHDAEHSERFLNAPLFKKVATVSARKVEVSEHLDTILANGFLETSREVPVGHWIITNPGGEQYAKSDANFRARYEHIKDDLWTATGIIRAYSNPTGGAVEIMTPWGAKQYGDSLCYFATAIDVISYEPTDFCYIIGAEEFKETYEWAEALNIVVQLLQVTGTKLTPE